MLTDEWQVVQVDAIRILQSVSECIDPTSNNNNNNTVIYKNILLLLLLLNE